MPELEVRPKIAFRKVSLKSGETLQLEAFQNDQPVQGAQWSLQAENPGTIDAGSGLYTAPQRIDRSQRIKATASKDGSSGATVIRLRPSFWTRIRRLWPHSRRPVVTVTDTGDGASGSAGGGAERLWTNPLGIYLLLCLILILGIVTWQWTNLCPTCNPGEVRVYPPAVTLTPSQSQLFTANVPVTWTGKGMGSSKSAPGLFSASSLNASKDNWVQIVATQTGGKHKSGVADVYLSSKGGLSLQPSQVTVSTGGSVDLIAVPLAPPSPQTPGQNQTGEAPQPPQVIWTGPSIGSITTSGPGNSNARFTVPPAAVDHPMTVQVFAQIADDPGRRAGAWISVKPTSLLTGVCEDGDGYDVGKLLLLLFLMGSLGGVIHGISSFSAFVGNRDFKPSWIWWYIYKPFQAGLVALAVFLVFRAGFGVGNFSLDTADCLKSSAFAIMIGLFSELAAIKLKDVFESLFTPRNDQRKDPLSGVSAPTLVRIDPPNVTVGKAPPSLILHGTGFVQDCQVKIGISGPRKPTPPVTATQLTVPLKPEDIKPGKVPIIVFNKPPDGDPSNTLELEVSDKQDGAAQVGGDGAGNG